MELRNRHNCHAVYRINRAFTGGLHQRSFGMKTDVALSGKLTTTYPSVSAEGLEEASCGIVQIKPGPSPNKYFQEEARFLLPAILEIEEQADFGEVG